MHKNLILILCLACGFGIRCSAQKIIWTGDGQFQTRFNNGNIVRVDPRTETETVVLGKALLTPAGSTDGLVPQFYEFTGDNSKALIFTNTVKVWRYKTRGDYYVAIPGSSTLKQLGKGLAPQSLMFAKFSPDSRHVAYVSEHNIYTEDINSGIIRKLTTDGTRKLINGTFDWVYEEEFGSRDGFRWSPDGKQIAFWQVNATKTPDYYMLNTTDSNYSQVIPVEYPKVGVSPSSVKLGVVNLSNGFIRWMNVEGDPEQNYIPRMEWSSSNEVILQQLDRKQQESKLMYCNAGDGSCRTFWAENSEAWVDLNTDNPKGWNWVNKGEDFLWVSEKDGWRHVYKISRDGKNITLLTKGDYDISSIQSIDEANNYLYFSASPSNPTQLYLYRTRINNSGKQKDDPELLSSSSLKGTHSYEFSPTAKLAIHSFSNHNTPPITEWLSFPDNRPVNSRKSIGTALAVNPNIHVEYIQIKTEDNILLDAWINKPDNFDPAKKYPVVFYVYGEPAASTVGDVYGNHDNFLYDGSMAADGYLQVALDNRGTPSLKGAAWRKSIYRKIGDINIRDMAMGAKKIIELPYIDKSRVAVWGWSGGGSSTLHLLFRYPEIFSTGVSIAAVANQLFYDNIYQERYMGLPQENLQDFIKGSPVTYAKGLKGNLLYIHGTGDDNVHYSNAEVLLNELIKHNKLFQFMAYPNRTHSLREGEGTGKHLQTLYTNFIRKNCPAGPR